MRALGLSNENHARFLDHVDENAVNPYGPVNADIYATPDRSVWMTVQLVEGGLLGSSIRIHLLEDATEEDAREALQDADYWTLSSHTLDIPVQGRLSEDVEWRNREAKRRVFTQFGLTMRDMGDSWEPVYYAYTERFARSHRLFIRE